MAETTVTDSGSSSGAGARTASKTGSFLQKHKTMAISVGIVVFIIIVYMFYRNSKSNAAYQQGTTAGSTGGSTISPADLAGLLSSIPQGPGGQQGPPGPPGPAGPPGKRPPPVKHKHRRVPPGRNHPAFPNSHPVPVPANNTIRRAAPPVHPLSQKTG